MDSRIGHVRPRRINCPECGDTHFDTIRVKGKRTIHTCKNSKCRAAWAMVGQNRYARVDIMYTTSAKPAIRYTPNVGPLTPGIPTGM